MGAGNGNGEMFECQRVDADRDAIIARMEAQDREFPLPPCCRMCGDLLISADEKGSGICIYCVVDAHEARI